MTGQHSVSVIGHPKPSLFENMIQHTGFEMMCIFSEGLFCPHPDSSKMNFVNDLTVFSHWIFVVATTSPKALRTISLP